NQIISVTDTFNQLEDPGMPIPPEASKVNGITDEMVKDKRIDDDAVNEFVAGADIILAHNSYFDRRICEKRLPVFKNLPWACSLAQIDWAGAGYISAKLEVIAYLQGFFYAAHRADVDCLALTRV